MEGQKLLHVLNEICKENFRISDDTILDKLYVHIESSPEIKVILDTLLPSIWDWLNNLRKLWLENALFHGVKVFSIRLFGLIGSTNEGFNILKESGILLHIQKLSTSDDEVQHDCSLRVPLINVYALFLKHVDGCKWIIESKVWEGVVEAFHSGRSLFITKASIKFLSLLLTTSKTYDINNGVNIINFICKPLIDNHFLLVDSLTTDEDDFQIRSLGKETTFIKENHRTNANLAQEKLNLSPEVINTARLVDCVLKDMNSNNAYLPAKLVFLPGSTNESIQLLLSTISDIPIQDQQIFFSLLLMVDFNNVAKDDCSSESSSCQLNGMYRRIYSVIEFMTQKNHVPAVIDFCVTSLSWVHKLKLQAQICNLNCVHCKYFQWSISDCLTILLHTCNDFICKWGQHGFNEKVHDGLKDILINKCSHKFKKPKALEYRGLYRSIHSKIFIECMSSNKRCVQYTQVGVFGLLRSISFITHTNIVDSVFEVVLSTLNSVVNQFEKQEFKNLLQPLLLHLLVLTNNLIDQSCFSYLQSDKDQNESIFIILARLLTMREIEDRVVITTLQTMKKVVRFYIVPDFLESGGLFQREHRELWAVICKLSSLESHLASSSWEVRDTTLEVFLAILELEIPEFSFLGVHLNKEILDKIYHVTVNDESSYVVATGLDLFSSVVRAKVFDHLFPASTLCELALKKVLDDMSVVRRSACCLISSIYVSYTHPYSEDGKKMYETMFTVSLKDIDWEVKKAALIFWKCTIDKCLIVKSIPIHPSVLIFSQRMTAEKVLPEVLDVLKFIGNTGCLRAVWLGLRDECDLTVSQEAFEIVTYLNELDQQWHFTETFSKGDDSIEETVNDTCRTLIPEEFFFHIKKQDWKKNLHDRKSWIENSCDNLTSLLDHILNEDNKIDDCEHNAVDCY